MLADTIQALVFDVFGTCTDWRGSVIRELQAVGRASCISADWDAIPDDCRREGSCWGPPMRAT